MSEERRLEQQRREGQVQRFDRRQQDENPEQLAQIERRAIDRCDEQRPQRLALALPFEGAAQRERSGKRDRDPEYPRRRIGDGASFAHEPEREDEHAREREEHRRVDNFLGPRLDQQVFPGHDPHRARKARHATWLDGTPSPPSARDTDASARPPTPPLSSLVTTTM